MIQGGVVTIIVLKTLVNKNSLSDDHEARNLSEEMVNIIESEDTHKATAWIVPCRCEFKR
ncbi:2781_t:CDS:2 [Entrophospora sp. SA101]|nr:2781_t:CDS:2 [Entrophospora sp. SA101]